MEQYIKYSQGTKQEVITTSVIPYEAGVLEGNTLASFLFIVVLDYVHYLSLGNMYGKALQVLPRLGRRHLAQHLRDLNIADDLALITEAVSSAVY